MGIIRNIAKNILPHYIVKKYQIYKAEQNIAKMPDIDDDGFEKINGAYIFSPQKSDIAFRDLYSKIQEYTLLGEIKSYALWQIVKEASKLNEGAFIEVGVWRGGSGALIAKQAEINGITDNIYLCDTFTGVVKSGKNDTFYENGEHSDTSKEIVEQLLKEYDIHNVKLAVGIFPDETSEFITDKKFRFAHIDVDVYESTKNIFDWIWQKMVVGGIILIDDYGFYRCNGITKFVNDERGKKDRIVFNNSDGQAVFIKINE
ncbi:MAG: TylF/MycF family methyltransferase [Spirochaetaceae bacterium]|jgi:Cdc6-like AAA superfamily ATPase|nr:TylF/MycF family methyltransferase [Spirochaetaceae bacterium]